MRCLKDKKPTKLSQKILPDELDIIINFVCLSGVANGWERDINGKIVVEMNKSQVQSISLVSSGRSLPQGLAWLWHPDNSRLFHFGKWSHVVAKIIAQKGNWGGLCLTEQGSVAAQGWMLWGLHHRNLQACVAAPRDAPPEIQPEPPVCLFMPPLPHSPTFHHCFNILDFDLKDRQSVKWKYLGRKVGTLLPGNERGKNLITFIKVLTVCTAAVGLFCVVMPVLRCICFHQRWWDQTDVGRRWNSNKKQANKSLFLKHIFTYEATILFGGKIKPPVLYCYLKNVHQKCFCL